MKSTPTTVHDAIYGEAGQRLSDIDWNLDCGSSTSRAADRSGGAANATGNCIRSAKGRTDYLYLDGLPIAVARYPASGLVPQISYLETDHLGTPRVAVDANTRAIQWRWDLLQTAFGDHPATPLVSGFELNLRYPGQYFDSETGSHYNYFRDYESRTGRYTQSDPIGIRGGTNVFLYVLGRPLTFKDSYGLSEDDVWLMLQEFRNAIETMTKEKLRVRNFLWNNFSTTYGINDYLACGDQSAYVKNKLIGLTLEDQWEFTIEHPTWWHMWLRARSSNPDDPQVIMDPWREKSSVLWCKNGADGCVYGEIENKAD